MNVISFDLVQKKSNFQIFRDVQQAENSKTRSTKNSNAIFRMVSGYCLFADKSLELRKSKILRVCLWSNRLPGLQLLMMLIILTSLIHGRLHANQFSYVFPPNISLQITDQVEEAGKIRLTAIIESRLGTLENLEIFFESSKDLQILSNASVIKSVPQASPSSKFSQSKPASSMTKWAHGWKWASDSPPTTKVVKAAVNDKQVYPDDFERQKLLNVVEKNLSENARYLEAVRHFVTR